MPNTFPCPNTQCTYQFDADILPAAAMVTCPLCRTRFPYRANQPVAPVTAGGEEPRVTGPRVVNVRNMPKRGSVWTTILGVAGFTIVLIGIIVAVTMRGRTRTETTQTVSVEAFNLKVDPFPAGWSEDTNARRPFNSNILGRRLGNTETYVAVSARDWFDREPRLSELDAELQRPLREALGTPFFRPIEGETWAGKKAIATEFAGNLEDVQVRGEAFAISYRGISYVYFAWSSDTTWESQRAELVALREKIKPAEFRDKWEAKKLSTAVHSPEGADYQVEDNDGVWILGKPADDWPEKEKNKFIVDDIKQLDSAAKLALMARYQPKERGDAKRQPIDALALVVELKSGDPLENAKAHVIERIKRDFAENPPEVTLEAVNKSPSGVALPTGGPAIVRLRFRNPLDRDQPELWVISAISVGGKTVAVEANVREKDAGYVDEWMVHLAGSLRAK